VGRYGPGNAHPVQVRGLRWHTDARGGLVEVHRRSWHGDLRPGEAAATPGEVAQVYVSTTAEGVVKGWHLHARQSDRFTVLRGSIVLGLYDLLAHQSAIRLGEALPPVHELVLHAERNPSQVVVPPGWAHGWMALPGYGEAHVLNAVSHEYDGTDEWRRDAHAGPCAGVHHEWRRSRDG
jgi:dTDP-4-dehydrorhamnose 3,5-epimerase